MPSVWVQNYFSKADLIYLYHNVSWQWEAPWAVGLVGRDEPNLQNRKPNLQKRMPNKTLWRTAALEWCETSQRCCHFYHNWCSLHCAAHIWLFGLGTAIPHNTKLSLISVQVPDVTNIVFFLCERGGGGMWKLAFPFLSFIPLWFLLSKETVSCQLRYRTCRRLHGNVKVSGEGRWKVERSWSHQNWMIQ